jgi:hypothetical protein
VQTIASSSSSSLRPSQPARGSWCRSGETRVLHILTIKGEFYQQLDLRRFPFDVQALTVGIQAREGSDKVIFTSGGSPRFGFGSCALAEWSRCDAEEAPMLKACMEIENHLPNEEEMEETEQVQRFLRSQGMYHYAIDGSAGRRTQHAIAKFQQERGTLKTDGVAGDKTNEEIRQAILEQQTVLNDEQFKCPLSGEWDDETDDAMKAYQKANGRTVDGVVSKQFKQKVAGKGFRTSSSSETSSEVRTCRQDPMVDHLSVMLLLNSCARL